jgi:hypothetical protein
LPRSKTIGCQHYNARAPRCRCGWDRRRKMGRPGKGVAEINLPSEFFTERMPTWHPDTAALQGAQVSKTHHYSHPQLHSRQKPDRHLIKLIGILSVNSASVARKLQSLLKCVICIFCVEGFWPNTQTRCEAPKLAFVFLVQVWAAGSHWVTFLGSGTFHPGYPIAEKCRVCQRPRPRLSLPHTDTVPLARGPPTFA